MQYLLPPRFLLLLLPCLLFLGVGKSWGQCGQPCAEVIGSNLSATLSQSSFTTASATFDVSINSSWANNSTSSSYFQVNFPETDCAINTGSNPFFRIQIAKTSTFDQYNGFFTDLGTCNAQMLSGGLQGTMVYNQSFARSGSPTTKSVSLTGLTNGTYYVIARLGNSSVGGTGVGAKFVQIGSFTVNISSGGCSVSLAPTSNTSLANIASTGNSITVNTTPNGSSWTATRPSPDSWLTLSPTTSSTGTSLTYSVTANNGTGATQRSTTITVTCGTGTQTFTVTQAGVSAPTTYTITGTVTASTGGGLSGVTVTTGAYSDATDATGVFSITNVPNTHSGTLTPTKAGYSFSPASLPVSSSSKTGKDFVGTAVCNATINSLTVTNITTNTAVVNWTATGASSYQLRYKQTSSSSWITLSNSVPASTTTYNITGLTMGTSYTVGIVAACSNGAFSSGDFENFTTKMPTITVESSIVAPWQRAGEEWSGTFKCTTSDVGGKWELVVLNNGVPDNTISGPYNSGQAVSINFGPENQVGKIYTYKIQHATANSVNAIAKRIDGSIASTTIIDKKWDRENIVYFNNYDYDNLPDISHKLSNIKIPIKSLPIGLNVQTLKFSFISNNTFDDGVSSGGGVLKTNIANYQYSNNSSNGLKDGYFILNAHSSNINKPEIFPSEYGCRISYLNASGNEVYFEYFSFELTKIGRVNYNFDKQKAIVVIGGYTGDADNSIQGWKFTNFQQDIFSKKYYSIIGLSSWNTNYATWYIGQCNENYTSRSAYSIGLALEKIKEIQNAAEMSLILHSKAGLEVRALISNNACSFKDMPNNFDGSPDNSITSKNFYLSSVLHTAQIIKKVVFLATPHTGGNWTGSVGNQLNGRSEALNDLGQFDSHDIIQVLKTTNMPNYIKFANLTALNTSYILTEGDGSVSIESSEWFSETYPNTLQMYQKADDTWSSSDGNGTTIGGIHGYATINNFLSGNDEKTSICYVNKDDYSRSSSLVKIIQFINGTTDSRTLYGCSRSKTTYFAIPFGSLLSGASFMVKKQGEPNYILEKVNEQKIGVSWQPFNAIANGDSLMVVANGYEALRFPVDNDIIQTKRMILPMLKGTATNKIQNPAIELVNQKSVVTTPSVAIKVTAKNISKYQIRKNTITWTDKMPADSLLTLSLDSMMNVIQVRFIGISNDTFYVAKRVFYLPEPDFGGFTYKTTVTTTPQAIDGKLYIDNVFERDITNLSTDIDVLNGNHTFKISKLGYLDVESKFDRDVFSDTTMHMAFIQRPNYSASDSKQFNLTTNTQPQYYRAMTFQKLAGAVENKVTLRRYNKDYALNLKPKSETFILENGSTQASAWTGLRGAIVLDQPETPNKDSIYVLWKNGNIYRKVLKNRWADSSIVYEPETQKLAFGRVRVKSTQEMTLMQTQAPIVIPDVVFTISRGVRKRVHINQIFADPDFVPNDLTFGTIVVNGAQLTYQIIGDSLEVRSVGCFEGNADVSVDGIHDGITKTNIIRFIVLPMTLTSTQVDVRPCFGDKTATIDLTVQGAVLPVTYLWSDGQQTQDIANLPKGAYTVTVKDAEGCQKQHIVNIAEPPVMSATADISDVRCFSEQNGGINFKPQGGEPPYTYRWWKDNATTVTIATTEDLANIGHGTYGVEVTDKFGCSKIFDNFQVKRPDILKVVATVKPVSCLSASDGGVTLTVTGGITNKPYTYQWSNGKTTKDIFGLMPTDALPLQVLVKDENNCAFTLNVTINLIPASTTSIATEPVCFGEKPILTFKYTGQVRPYTIKYTDGVQTFTIPNLTADEHEVTINNPVNNTVYKLTEVSYAGSGVCKAGVSGEAKIVIWDLPKVLKVETKPENCGNKNGKIWFEMPAQGQAPFLYSIDEGDNFRTVAKFDSLSKGRYTLLIKDLNGCEYEYAQAININEINCPLVGLPNLITPNGDGKNDKWEPEVLRYHKKCIVIVFDRSGRQVYKSEAGYYPKPWDGTNNGTELPMDTYYYTIDLRDGSEVYKGFITLMR